MSAAVFFNSVWLVVAIYLFWKNRKDWDHFTAAAFWGCLVIANIWNAANWVTSQ